MRWTGLLVGFLLVLTVACRAPQSSGYVPFQNGEAQVFPVNCTRFFLVQQWWTSEYLTTEIAVMGETNAMGMVDHTYWLKREHRTTGAVEYLQVPGLSPRVTSRDGSFWVLTEPWIPFEKQRLQRTPSEGDDHIFRCDDFKTWKPIATIPHYRSSYFGCFEVLDGNKFLLFGRWGRQQNDNHYAIAKIANGVLKVEQQIRLSGVDQAVIKEAFFHRFVRNSDYVIHFASGPGWGLVFNSHSGAFLRMIRAYDVPKHGMPANGHMSDYTLLFMRVTSDGKFLMACRSREFAEYFDDHEKVRRQGSPLMFKPYLDDLDIYWRILDAGSGEMKPIDPPANVPQKLNTDYLHRPFSMWYRPDQSLREEDSMIP